LYDEHWTRFENSAQLIHLDLGLTKDQMTDEIRQTVRATNPVQRNRDVYVRYTVTRGEGPVDLFPSPELNTRYLIIVKELTDWNPGFYRMGVRLAIPDTRRNSTTTLDPNIKGGNYLNNVLGVIEARALGADDCVMLNDSGLITEASNSNVFFVINGTLITPAESAGHLRGLTKGAVQKVCAARDLEILSREISVNDLSETTECFVTSATREVMPVLSLRLPEGRTLEYPEGGGPLTRRVMDYYRDFVGAHLHDYAHLSMF
jgi:branched-subunit amino acid aminotransferase/4-amino-4-deoxychorismate lyase